MFLCPFIKSLFCNDKRQTHWPCHLNAQQIEKESVRLEIISSLLFLFFIFRRAADKNPILGHNYHARQWKRSTRRGIAFSALHSLINSYYYRLELKKMRARSASFICLLLKTDTSLRQTIADFFYQRPHLYIVCVFKAIWKSRFCDAITSGMYNKASKVLQGRIALWTEQMNVSDFDLSVF
jgi:hypothetical protein